MTVEVATSKDEFVKRLEEILSSEVEDYGIVINCPYVEYIEYGSTPATSNESKMPKVDDQKDIDPKTHKPRQVTIARLNIRDWAARKYGLNDEERIKQGDQFYKYIMDHGAAPHPFIRPAYHDMENIKTADLLQMVEAENPFEAYAKHFVDRMIYHLKQNGSILGEASLIERSIEIKKVSDIPSGIRKVNVQGGERQ